MMKIVSTCAAVAALVTGSGLAAVGFAGPASADTVADQAVGVAQCQPNTSQKCPQDAQVDYNVPADGLVQAHFTANANHCSDINVRLIKDEPSTGWYPMSDWMRVGPGQTVDSPKSDRTAGGHVIKVQAEGIDGGCNTGHLDAWGGTLRVDFTPDSGPIGEPDVPKFQLPDLGVPGPPEGLDVN
jgi:hypothetical protein